MLVSPKDVYHTLRQLRSLAEVERESFEFTSLSPSERAWYWRRGFLSRSAVLYDFETYGHEDYLTDYQRYVRTRGINGRFGYALDNKLMLYGLLSGFSDRLPDLHGIISDGTFRSISMAGERGPTRSAIRWAEDLDAGETVVVKWVIGGGGHSVLLLTRTDDGYRINGERVSRGDLRERFEGMDDYIVTGFSEQADYADAFYSESTNTVRAVTMWDVERDEPFLARAIHRIGTSSTKPMDNWSQGALGALIDPETGKLGEAVTYPENGERTWRTSHPDTGARVAGVEIPDWEAIREGLLDVADSVPYLPYVGWDLVVTDEGEFEIIEANNYPGVKSLQVHGPLCADERVERFYREHGVR
ncbi:sugar-transfer associated ATP-grasp domain-containing protein [Halalkalicoccus sp. NIPERK01]|uniref:sugar-transfer associated ATP-grasp domain-containing protein n=1 Tax=Halalkalicoccus sp. NIPERK01 TaxID=3053469 RepID=UPI00256F47D2|nr:sugar-transfer associated ATP-grasp domain-containing protein [Halalkalicoccus sp. NIPERK01]MDL5361888.1 sugar-transfer associated ATP-grasp domain-containing protein [Halalkalicoccus sp. NIPERK01]